MAVRKRKAPWGWLVLVLLIAGGAGGYYMYQQNNSKKAAELPKGVQIGTVTRGDLDQKVTATGVVAAQTGAKVNIGSRITGRVKSLPADVGAHVAQNQVVAILEVPDLEAQVEQQRRSVEVARASLAQAIPRLEQARLSVQLAKDQNQAQIDEADYAVRAARARLEGSESANKMQPSQTSAEIARTQAVLATAKTGEHQVKQTVAQQLLQAQTTIDEAQATVTFVERQRKRQEALLGQGFVSRQEVDDIRAQHQQAIARLKSAQANQRIVKEKTEADIQNARAQVTQAEAAVAAAVAATANNAIRESELRTSQETVRQAEASFALRKSNLTENQIRQKAYLESKAGVAQARAALKQAEALLQYQQAQLDLAVIRSPISGTVLTINTQQGETVAAGFSVQTLIAVADLNRLEVRAYVDETDVGRVRLGLPVEVRVQTYQDRVFHGHVSKIAAAATVKDNVVTYETTVAIDDAKGLLRPDMTADVTLILGRRPNVLLVPSEAVHQAVGRALIYVLHRDKKGKERAEMRDVTLGTNDGIHTEIRTVLKEREEVILAGLPRLGVEAIDSQTAKPNSGEQK